MLWVMTNVVNGCYRRWARANGVDVRVSCLVMLLNRTADSVRPSME